MGRGDDELGRTLMATYLDTLAHFSPSISKVIFVNSGVRLTVKGSPVLDAIKNLENAGVRILSCGTCLNHFGLKEKLNVGEVSNMYAIIEAISKGQKVMMP
jgi:selenium metabolism protein YedF